MGGKTNQEARTAIVNLDFLDPGKKYLCTLYADAKEADYEKNPKAYTITRKVVKKGDVIKVKEARGGGFAMSIIPQ